MKILRTKEGFVTVVYVMIAFLFLFQVLDVYGTVYGIERGLPELNPLAKQILESPIERPFLFLMAFKTTAMFLMLVVLDWWKSTNAYDYKFSRWVVFGVTTVVFTLYLFQSVIHIYNFITL